MQQPDTQTDMDKEINLLSFPVYKKSHQPVADGFCLLLHYRKIFFPWPHLIAILLAIVFTYLYNIFVVAATHVDNSCLNVTVPKEGYKEKSYQGLHL